MTGLAPGVYDVSVIDNDGCTQSIQIIILPGGQVSIVGIFHN